ncbi:MAG: arabinogalactan endo-1,4-beta-galactosidase [Bacilli bacterium]|nr:arabinogalactan endo-1,4-beta-galactosidase [Bacilli bacterium]
MKLGLDLSVQDELDKLNPHYTYEGKEIEPFHFFAEHSKVSTIRIRLWHDPYDKEGHPYGGGTNDLDCFLRLAKRAQKEGMEVMIDFHYSDFYVDPSRQIPPKAWASLKNIDEIEEALYKYTKETLETIKANGIDLVAIQVGNEITHGLLRPWGDNELQYDEAKGGGWKGLGRLLKAGCKASKEVFPKAKTVIHLEHSGSWDMQNWYFSNLVEQKVEFDVIGESYYPYWHGPFSMFKDCITRLKEKFKKEIWVVELGYEYVPLPEDHDFSVVTDAKEGDFIVGNLNGRIPFPQTPEGQAEYVGFMIKICKELGVEMLCYWEPTWIYLPNNGWASDAGQIYCGLTPSAPANSWAIETFFNQKGEANPIVDVFTQDYVDKI